MINPIPLPPPVTSSVRTPLSLPIPIKREVLLHGENVVRTYNIGRPNAVEALRGVTFDIRRGEFLAITGPSGSGKSTLLNMIGLIDQPTEGSVFALGKDLSTLSERQRTEFQLNFVSFVFQFFNLIDTYTALENIMFPLRLQGRSIFDSRKKAKEVLEFLGLSHRALQYAKDLSGGEQQRVAVGRALAKDSEIILADEPTAHLDTVGSREVIELLRSVNRAYGRTVVVVTHQPEQAEGADRNLTIQDGRIVSNITRSVV